MILEMHDAFVKEYKQDKKSDAAVFAVIILMVLIIWCL